MGELQVIGKNCVLNEGAIPEHFEEVICFLMVKDNSFPVPSWVLADAVDGQFPVLDELYNVT